MGQKMSGLARAPLIGAGDILTWQAVPEPSGNPGRTEEVLRRDDSVRYERHQSAQWSCRDSTPWVRPSLRLRLARPQVGG